MKIVTIIVRILLALIFLVFGFNGFFHFLHMSAKMSPVAIQFLTAVSTTGFMAVIFAMQILGGLLLLVGLVPLGLTILCPIIFNILLFHACMEPSGLPLGIVCALLALFLVWRHWANFAGLVRPGA
ncbi:MAG TPA: hypothetical protein VHW03_00350 [Chthoniobacterales bacterium]|jgi:hypothetical protein|nr:hypothetical protein [Chthoniobacterales bacterium]